MECGEELLTPEVEENCESIGCVIGCYPTSSYSFSGNLRSNTELCYELCDEGGIKISHECGASRLIPILVQQKLEKMLRVPSVRPLIKEISRLQSSVKKAGEEEAIECPTAFPRNQPPAFCSIFTIEQEAKSRI